VKSLIYALLGLLVTQVLYAADETVTSESGSVEISPGKFHEPCMSLRRGDTLRYQFNADQPLEFNLHYHPGGNVEYPIPVMLMEEGKGTFKPGSDFTYCLMWQNRTTENVRMSFSWSVG